jgi:hypothetical protein
MNSAIGIKLYCLMWIECYHTTKFRINTQMPSQFIGASDPSLPIVLTREKNPVLWIWILIHFLLMYEVMSGSPIIHRSGSTYNVKKQLAMSLVTFFNFEQVDSMFRSSVADPDLGSGAFYTQGSEKGFFHSRISKPYFEIFVIIFGGRKFYNSFGMDKNQDKVWISEYRTKSCICLLTKKD